MGSTKDERSMLGALEPGSRLDAGSTDEERAILEEISDEEGSILGDFNHIREHIQTLEEAARVARAVEFEQLRAVVEQLEAVAGAAKAVERDLSQELANTNRLSVSTARLMRDRLAGTLRALAEALVTADRNGPN
jgi:ABC-type transporter Mla subunit MlaD